MLVTPRPKSIGYRFLTRGSRSSPCPLVVGNPVCLERDPTRTELSIQADGLFDADGDFSARMNLVPARTTFERDRAIPTGWVCYDPHIMFPGRLEVALEFPRKFGFDPEAVRGLGPYQFFCLNNLGRETRG